MKKVLCVMAFVVLMVAVGFAANGPKDAILEELRAEIAANGWDYTVGHNAAMQYDIEQLCTLNPELAPLSFDIADNSDRNVSRVQVLPAAYTGYCGGVRNQGSCGSCWAFGIVGAVEGAYGFQAGLVKDLSEQQELDCNSEGYSCNGGWFTFGVPMNPGLTNETNYPYVAYKKTCTVTSPYYPISASYYCYNSSSVAPTTTIKEDIQTYGNVAAAVYVSTAFQAYTGGTFATCRNRSCNHAIILCGWDDSKGAWRLKNSWGTSWGEAGFMWIKYLCCNVGYAACYAVY
jgi:C1A family cysteine protease